MVGELEADCSRILRIFASAFPCPGRPFAGPLETTASVLAASRLFDESRLLPSLLLLAVFLNRRTVFPGTIFLILLSLVVDPLCVPGVCASLVPCSCTSLVRRPFATRFLAF